MPFTKMVGEELTVALDFGPDGAKKLSPGERIVDVLDANVYVGKDRVAWLFDLAGATKVTVTAHTADGPVHYTFGPLVNPVQGLIHVNQGALVLADGMKVANSDGVVSGAPTRVGLKLAAGGAKGFYIIQMQVLTDKGQKPTLRDTLTVV